MVGVTTNEVELFVRVPADLLERLHDAVPDGSTAVAEVGKAIWCHVERLEWVAAHEGDPPPPPQVDRSMIGYIERGGKPLTTMPPAQADPDLIGSIERDEDRRGRYVAKRRWLRRA